MSRGGQVVLTLGLLVMSCSASVTPSPTPSAQQTPSATATATTSATPLVPYAPEPRGARSFPAAPEGSAITGMVAGGPGFVAVGFDGHSRAMVWLSTDGAEWRAVPHGPQFEGAVMSGVASRGGRIVAVGREVSLPERMNAAAWTSDDGMVWHRVAGSDLDDGQMVGVTAVPAGFVAVGTGPFGSDRAAMWTSADGSVWSRTPHQSDFEHSFMWSVTSTSLGLIATGWRRDPEPSAAIWRSADGRAWSLMDAPADGAGFQVRAVTTVGAMLVAAGDSVATRQAATWISRDGKSWLQPSQPQSFDGAAIHTLTAMAQGVIAVGGLNDNAAMWTSLDGQTWTTTVGDAELQGAYMTSVVFRDRLVFGGATQQRIPGTGSFVQRAFAWFDARGSPR